MPTAGKQTGHQITTAIKGRSFDLLLGNPMVAGLILMVVGVVLREHLGNNFSDPLFFSIAVLATFGTLFLPAAIRTKVGIWCLSSLIVLGCGWLHQKKLNFAQQQIEQFPAPADWQPVHLNGYVDSIPQFRPDESPFAERRVIADAEIDPRNARWITTIDINVDKLLSNKFSRSKETSVTGSIRVTIPGRHRNFAPGDKVDCYLKWRKTKLPTNPGEPDFVSRLRQYGIYGQGQAKSISQVITLDQPKWWRPSRYLGRFAMAGDAAIERYVTAGQAPLAVALVLGQRGQIEWELQESLLETGTIHMLAISGLHVEMVVLSIAAFCFALRLRIRLTLLVIVIAVVMYATICGANPPVLRATIFVVLTAAAKLFGLTVRSINLLSFVALALLVYRTDHMWDTGAQLSFLAVAILILFAVSRRIGVDKPDPLEAILESQESPFKRSLLGCKNYSREVINASTWVWLLTTPIVVSSFHIVAPVAILMNLLLVIPLWLGLLSGLGVALLGTWLPGAGYILGFICGASLWFTSAAIELVSFAPGLHWWSSSPPAWWVATFYVLFVLMLCIFGFSRKARRIILSVMLTWLIIGLIPWLQFFPQANFLRTAYGLPVGDQEPKFAITFIDVGHGTSVMIQTPERHCWLYDVGRLGDPNRSFYPIASTLWFYKTPTIDRVFLSHADADHFNAFPAIAKRFHIKQITTTDRFLASTDPAVQPILQLLTEGNYEIDTRQAGDQFEADGIRLEFLHPPAEQSNGTDNAVSLCLCLEYGGYCFLLPGDLEGDGTRALLQRPPMKINVLMAPHHGSLAQSPDPLLGWCKPEHVVVSGGSRTLRPKVFDSFSSSGARDVWVTARDNAIRFEIRDDQELIPLHWHHNRWELLEHRASGDYYPVDDED